ncbi:hypothetical protein BJ546DRAFT_382634 [Cryomyces antarcticus]
MWAESGHVFPFVSFFCIHYCFSLPSPGWHIEPPSPLRSALTAYLSGSLMLCCTYPAGPTDVRDRMESSSPRLHLVCRAPPTRLFGIKLPTGYPSTPVPSRPLLSFRAASSQKAQLAPGARTRPHRARAPCIPLDPARVPAVQQRALLLQTRHRPSGTATASHLRVRFRFRVCQVFQHAPVVAQHPLPHSPRDGVDCRAARFAAARLEEQDLDEARVGLRLGEGFGKRGGRARGRGCAGAGGGVAGPLREGADEDDAVRGREVVADVGCCGDAGSEVNDGVAEGAGRVGGAAVGAFAGRAGGLGGGRAWFKGWGR